MSAFVCVCVCVTLITFLSAHCLMFTSVNYIYFSLAGYDTVKLPEFFLPLLHTHIPTDTKEERERQKRERDAYALYCVYGDSKSILHLQVSGL